MQETQFRPTPDEAVATQPPMDCSQTVNHPPMLAYHQPSHSGQSKRLLQCILSTDGHWNHDKDTGYTRYYAPTSNVHVYNEIVPASSTADTWEQRRRISRVIKDLPTETHDYLMELFWTQHNTILHVVNKEAYYQDKENDNVRYYSGFLHICILAMGLRYADKSRPDIQRLTFGDEESSLLREARYLSEYAVNHSAELTRIQALLLLGDLECGLARDNSGWMYTGTFEVMQFRHFEAHFIIRASMSFSARYGITPGPYPAGSQPGRSSKQGFNLLCLYRLRSVSVANVTARLSTGTTY